MAFHSIKIVHAFFFVFWGFFFRMNRSSLAICLTFLMFLLMVPKIDSGSKATRARPPLRRAKNILSEALLFGHLLSGKRRRYIAQQITHVGKCPAVNMTTSSDAECLDRCQYDIHCPYTKKCCGDGCGKKCVDIVGEYG